MRPQIRRLAAVLAALLAVIGLSSALYAITVQPVVIDLTTSGRGMGQIITVENTFDRPLPVEIRMEGLTLTPDGIESSGRDTGELAVFPPTAMIDPGQRQSFRVQYVGDPGITQSRHHFVTVAQLPVQLAEASSNVQLLYNFQILVSVSPEGMRPDLSIQSAEIGRDAEGAPVPVILVTNASGAHGYLSRGRLRVVQRDESGRELFSRQLSGPEIQQTIGYGLIGGGQTRRVVLPIPLPQPGGRIEAQFTPDA